MGTVREVAEEGGSGPNRIIKVLLRGGPGGATIWFGNLAVAGSNAAKTLGVTREFHAEGDGNEGSNDWRRHE